MAVTREQLVGLYLAYFGRPPDVDGYLYYTTQTNLTLTQIEANFSASPESQAMYGTGSLSQLIDAIYVNLFNRHAEPDGIVFWSNAINQGYVTPAGAAYNILLGAQNDDKIAVQNKMTVANDWLTHLDTTAEITGYSGADANAVAREFLHTVDSTAGSLATAETNLDTEIQLAINASNPGPLSVTISAPTVVEGNNNTKQLAYTITLSHASATAVTVNYTTVAGGGTATAGDDYDAQSGAITFIPGQTTQTVNITVNGDITVENDETVQLQVTGSSISNSGVSALGTILNADATPLLTTGIDSINVLGTGANLITGIVDGGTPANSTFSVGDTINGNGLTVLQLDVAVAGTGAFAFVHNVSEVDVVAGTAGVINFNAIEWTDVGAVKLTTGGSGLTVHVSSLETGVDLSIAAGLGGQISATYQSGMYADIFNSGKGGASFIDGDVTVHMKNGATGGAFFSASNDLAIGNVVIFFFFVAVVVLLCV